MIDKLTRLLRGADGSREKDSPRGGLLSYAGEWHALLIGVALGGGALAIV